MLKQLLKQWLNKDKRIIGKMLVAPLFAVLMICFISSSMYIENIPLAIADMDNSSLSRKIVSEFENHSGFSVTLYADSEEALQDAVYHKKAVAGLLIPAGYGNRVAQMDGANAILLLDGTNTTTSSTAQGYASAIFSTLSAGIQMQALESGGISDQNIQAMMGSFSFSERTMYNEYGSFMYNIIYTVIPYMIQMQYLCFFLFPLLWEERESGRLTQRGNYFMFFRIISMLALIGVSTYAAMLVGSLLFHMPVSPNFLCHFILIVAYTIAVSAVSFVISLFTRSTAKYYAFELFCIIGVLIMLTSGMVWPEFAMPDGFPTIIRILWPFAQITKPFKALHLKGAGFLETLPAIRYCVLFAICWLVIGLLILAWRDYKNRARYNIGDGSRNVT